MKTAFRSLSILLRVHNILDTPWIIELRAVRYYNIQEEFKLEEKQHSDGRANEQRQNEYEAAGRDPAPVKVRG